jgi:hypothetical protein
MIENFLDIINDLFALDIDVLSARQWWVSGPASDTIKSINSITDKYFIANEFYIKLSCDADPTKLKSLLEKNIYFNNLVNELFALGKGILHQSYLYNININSDSKTLEVLIKEFNDINTKIIEFNHSLFCEIEQCRTTPNMLNSGVFESLKKYQIDLYDEARNIFNSSNIINEVNNNTSLSSSSSSSYSNINPTPRSNSPVLDELKKYPNPFHK